MRKGYLIAGACTACLIMLTCCQHQPKKTPQGKETLPPVEVHTEVDKTTATTGDLIRYTLSANSEPALEVEIPEMGSQIAGFRIVDMGATGPIERDGRKIMEKWYQLKADLVGSYIIPSAVFSYYDERKEKKELKTAQIFIEVQSVIDDKEAAKDIKDIKSLAEIKRDYTMIIAFSLAGAALLVLGIGGIYWYRTQYQRVKALPPRPAHELALEELNQLRYQGLIEKGVYKDHYFKLSEIFRRYLERRFRFPAVERTTEEILPEISHLRGLDERTQRGAHKFLSETDLVKFANYIPTTQEVDREYQEAVEFINETKEEPIRISQPL